MTRRSPCIVVSTFWFVLALATPALAALDGNQWLRLSDSARGTYVWGVVDTWEEAWSGIKLVTDTNPSYAPGVVESALRLTSDCTKSMTYGQIIALVEKYMKDHPERWHYRMASIIWSAVQATCKQ